MYKNDRFKSSGGFLQFEMLLVLLWLLEYGLAGFIIGGIFEHPLVGLLIGILVGLHPSQYLTGKTVDSLGEFAALSLPILIAICVFNWPLTGLPILLFMVAAVIAHAIDAIRGLRNSKSAEEIE